jgi:thiol:disulfide interchange protein
VPATYIYLDKIILKDSKDSIINFKLLGKKEEKEDIFFGLIEIVDADFKIKFSPQNEEKIDLNYQGCYKNKVCYPSKMRNVIIKYDKKSISSVKIDQISSKI